MKTPAGKECKYFYGDYYRGRNHEECGLLKSAEEHWTRDLCATCPVPGILQANACEFLRLRPVIARPFASVFQRRVKVTSFCEKISSQVSEPHIGCGQCHQLPAEFRKAA